VILPAGEQTKSFQNLEILSEKILGHGITRQSLIIALGGGVVGDIAGFFAAIALRGVDFVQIPTTLLSQIDSAVGGKTAINAKAGKNLVGAFHQPRLVLADTGCLQTLPARELRAGYAEMVKYGLLGDAAFFHWLDEHAASMLPGDAVRDDDSTLTQAILRCCQIKADIVAKDERETGLRELLNLGHTFGHAIETILGYDKILHGEAVAIGMHMACQFSVSLGFCDKKIMPLIDRHWDNMQLPKSVRDVSNREIMPEEWLAVMGRDKKNRHGKIRLILLKSIGEAFASSEIQSTDLQEFLRKI
ncbi:MAG: 3-dehydroquinate synthase, partial [Pseudomonadota bacterium]